MGVIPEKVQLAKDWVDDAITAFKHTNPTIFMKIEDVVKSIKGEKGVEAVYLFGSRASGKQKPYSDTDICVITGKGAKKEKILSNSSKSIDTSIFWDLPLSIRFRVIKEGKPLYVKNKMKMQRVEAETVLSYLDFKPLLERHLSRFLG